MNKPKNKLDDVYIKALDTYADNFPSGKSSQEIKQSTSPLSVKSQLPEKRIKDRPVTLTLKIPKYIDRQITLMAANTEDTKKGLILKGLQKMGVEINLEDISDARGRK